MSERKINLSEYIEAKLPKTFRSRNNKSVDTYLSSSLELIDVELSENSVFTMPDIPIKSANSFRER